MADLTNRVSEALKERKVNQACQAWMGWMPPVLWYAAPSFPACLCLLRSHSSTAAPLHVSSEQIHPYQSGENEKPGTNNTSALLTLTPFTHSSSSSASHHCWLSKINRLHSLIHPPNCFSPLFLSSSLIPPVLLLLTCFLFVAWHETFILICRPAWSSMRRETLVTDKSRQTRSLINNHNWLQWWSALINNHNWLQWWSGHIRSFSFISVLRLRRELLSDSLIHLVILHSVISQTFTQSLINPSLIYQSLSHPSLTCITLMFIISSHYITRIIYS